MRTLRFEDKPDYAYLKRLFRELAVREGFEMDGVFDWTVQKDGSSAASAAGSDAKGGGGGGGVAGAGADGGRAEGGGGDVAGGGPGHVHLGSTQMGRHDLGPGSMLLRSKTSSSGILPTSLFVWLASPQHSDGARSAC